MKKLLCGIAMTGLFILSLPGCGQTEAADSGAPLSQAKTDSASENTDTAMNDSADEDMAEIEVLYFSMAATNSEGIQAVEDAINEISENKINTRVHLTVLESGNWDQQINLMVSSGEQMDLIPTFFAGSTSFATMYSQNQLMPLNDLLPEYGQEILEQMPDQYLDATTVNGNIYAVPTLKDNVTNAYLAMRTDVLEDLGLLEAAKNVKSMDDVEVIMKAVKENTELVPLSGTPLGGAIFAGNIYFTGEFDSAVDYDRLVNDYIVTMGDDSETVVNLFETEEFAKAAALAQDWYDKGYVYKDIANMEDSSYGMIAAGKCFALFFGAEESTCNATVSQCGYDMTVVKIASQPVATSAVNTITWAVPVTSKEPEAAVKFLSLMYTDADIVNLLNYGVEGTDYIVKADGTFDFPEGVDTTNCRYHMDTSYLFGNQFLAGVWAGDDPEIRQKAKEINDHAKMADNFGFVADVAGYDTQISGISSAYNEYFKSLICGLVDSESELKNFNEKLKAAGIDTLVSGIQEQLDAWRSGKILASTVEAKAALSSAGASETLPAASEISSGVAETSPAQAQSSVSQDYNITWEDMAEIVVMYPAMSSIPSGLEDVETAINEITEKEINTHVKLLMTESGSHDQQLNLMMSANEQLDLVVTIPAGASSFSTMASQGQLMDITEIMEAYAPKTLATVGDLIRGTQMDGRTYGLTCYNSFATGIFINMRTDVLRDLNLLEKAENITSFTEFEEIMKAVKESGEWNYLAGIAPSDSRGSVLANNTSVAFADKFDDCRPMDNLGNTQAAVAVLDSSAQVVNTFATEEWKHNCDIVREWYDKGYVYKDSSTTSEMGASIIKANAAFSYICQAELGSEANINANCGMDMTSVLVTKLPITTGSLTKFTWGVPTISKEPKAAVTFLEMLFNDSRVANLFIWGREGIDYEVGADGIAKYIEGNEEPAYHSDAFLAPNKFTVCPWEGDDPLQLEKARQNMAHALTSDYLGFSVDTSSLSNEVSAVTNVIAQYQAQLSSGVADDSVYEDFLRKLDTSGIDKMINLYQEELDQWLEAVK